MHLITIFDSAVGMEVKRKCPSMERKDTLTHKHPHTTHPHTNTGKKITHTHKHLFFGQNEYERLERR